MTRINFTLILNFISLTLFSQLSSVDHWETIINADAFFKYKTNMGSMTDSNWRNNDYDNSLWSEGKGGFGYGDNDDNTVIEGITSVFLIKQFTLVDKSEIAAAILNIDYDDAFVAYLNGMEIARSQGLTDLYPRFNILSSQQHEAVMPEGGIPPNIIIDTDKLQVNLVEGTNTIAVQVHNASSTSSDLSSNIWFSVGLNVSTERYLDTPIWFSETTTEEFNSNLPILVINTENGSPILDDPKITAHLGIVYNENGERNYSDGPFTEYDGSIGIEIRGNSTATQPKKPYSFETRDNLGEDVNVSLFGLPAESDWILRASYFDHTFARNPLANYMSRHTGYWASKTKHVEVILNGEYQGVYLFMEKIKRDKNRVDISKLELTEVSGEDLTGGYIWEVTGFDNNFGESRKLKYPKYDEVHATQLEYIQNFDNAFRNKMRSSSIAYSNPNTGYVEHIWAESFIYEVIIQEAMRNSDAYGWSGYYHKDKNGLINAGPVWDFDQSSGNSSYPDNGVVDGWLIKHPNTSNTPFYWSRLLDDPYFRYSLSLRWKELRADKFKTVKLLTYVDSIASTLSEAEVREFKKWPVLGENVWRETLGYEQRDTYQKEVDHLKEFLTERWEWMDSQLANILKPTGYPEILITEDVISRKYSLSNQMIELNLNNLFSFPYTSKLKYKAYSTDDSIIFPDVKKTGFLELDLNSLGFCDVIITAIDTYGNKKNITLQLETVETLGVALLPSEITKNSLTIFPNPASNNISLKLENENNTYIDIELYSLTGRLIDIVYQGPNRKSINYNCSKIANGIYFIKLKTDSNKVYTRKFILVR
jgi:hypothetical protein